MPFYALDNEEIVKFIPQIPYHKDEIKYEQIKKEKCYLQDQVQLLKCEINALKHSLDSASVLNRSLEAKLSQTNDTLKSTLIQSESKTSRDKKTRQQMERLQLENKTLKSELSKIQHQQQQQQEEIKLKLSESVLTSSETQAQIEYKHNLLKQEMTSMTNWYCALDSSNMMHPNQLVSPCQNCGSRVFHEQRICPAIRNTCLLCLKPGHFSVFCQTKKLF